MCDPKGCQTKGQLISKCPFGVFKSTKKSTKLLSGFLPKPLKRGQIKNYAANCMILLRLFYTNFLFDFFLEARVEILTKISCFLGGDLTPKGQFEFN